MIELIGGFHYFADMPKNGNCAAVRKYDVGL